MLTYLYAYVIIEDELIKGFTIMINKFIKKFINIKLKTKICNEENMVPFSNNPLLLASFVLDEGVCNFISKILHQSLSQLSPKSSKVIQDEDGEYYIDCFSAGSFYHFASIIKSNPHLLKNLTDKFNEVELMIFTEVETSSVHFINNQGRVDYCEILEPSNILIDKIKLYTKNMLLENNEFINKFLKTYVGENIENNEPIFWVINFINYIIKQPKIINDDAFLTSICENLMVYSLLSIETKGALPSLLFKNKQILNEINKQKFMEWLDCFKPSPFIQTIVKQRLFLILVGNLTENFINEDEYIKSLNFAIYLNDSNDFKLFLNLFNSNEQYKFQKTQAAKNVFINLLSKLFDYEIIRLWNIMISPVPVLTSAKNPMLKYYKEIADQYSSILILNIQEVFFSIIPLEIIKRKLEKKVPCIQILKERTKIKNSTQIKYMENIFKMQKMIDSNETNWWLLD